MMLNNIENTIEKLFIRLYPHKYTTIDIDVRYDDVKDKYLVTIADNMYDAWIKEVKEKKGLFRKLHDNDFYRMVEDSVYSDLQKISQYLNRSIDVKIKKK